MTPIRTRLLAMCCALFMLATACSSGAETATVELPTLADTTEEKGTNDGADDSAATGDENEDGTTEEDDDGETDEEVDPEIAMAEYEQCMEEQGVSMSLAVEGGDGASIETLETDADANDDSLELSGEGLDLEEFEAAAEACDPILEDAFGSFEMTPEQEAEMADQMLELEKCLADEGFDIDMSGGNSFQIGGDDMDFEAFEEAMQTCGNDIQTIDAG